MKMKTHSGAKKRFKVTGSGKIKRRQAGKRHLNEHMSSKAIRNLRGTVYVNPANMYQTERLLGL